MLVAGGDPGLTAMPTLLKALRGISLLSLLAKGASPLRITLTSKRAGLDSSFIGKRTPSFVGPGWLT